MAVLARFKVNMPERVWHGWAAVIAKFPGADTLPRIDVIAKGASEYLERDRLGWYDRERHAIIVIDDGDPNETLHTLMHELAHAWNHDERLHHGPGWQTTMCAMIAWFFGVKFDRSIPLSTVPILRKNEPDLSRTRAQMLAVDIALHESILRFQPTIKITTTDEQTDLLVTVDKGRVVHHVIQPKAKPSEIQTDVTRRLRIVAEET